MKHTTNNYDDADEPITSAQAIIDTVERLVQPAEIHLDQDEEGRPRVLKIVAVPEGLKLHSLKPFEDERRARPERREGTATHTTLESFSAGINRFADEGSVIWASDDPRNPKLTAVFDYHEGNLSAGSAEEPPKVAADVAGKPRFGKHRAVYAFPLSPEWQAWVGIGGRDLSQRELCEFLEEHIPEVTDPGRLSDSTQAIAEQLGFTLATPDQLMTLARGLSFRVDTKIASAVNLSSGESQLIYEETHRDKDSGAPLNMPGGFAISVPVVRGGAPYALVVRMRHKVQGGTITFKLGMHRADLVFRHAFDEACEIVVKRTGVPLFYGSPES